MYTTDAIQMQIDALEHAYGIELKYFLLDVQNEQASTNYEKNLINKLIGMQQLKSEIKSLKQAIEFCNIPT